MRPNWSARILNWCANQLCSVGAWCIDSNFNLVSSVGTRCIELASDINLYIMTDEERREFDQSLQKSHISVMWRIESENLFDHSAPVPVRATKPRRRTGHHRYN